MLISVPVLVVIKMIVKEFIQNKKKIKAEEQ